MNMDMVMYVVFRVQENPKNPSLVKIHHLSFMKDCMNENECMAMKMLSNTLHAWCRLTVLTVRGSMRVILRKNQL